MVSIVIFYYNGAKYILDTLKSCLDQTYNDIEIIILNDCSKEDLPESELIRDTRVRVLKNEINMGVARSANKVVKYVKGEFLLFIGQDDLLSPDHVAKMITKFEDSDVGFVFCDYQLIDAQGELIKENGERSFKNEYEIYDYSLGNKIHSCGLMMRKAAYLSAGGYVVNRNYPNYGEWNLWIRLLLVSRGVFCKDVKSFYRRHGDNMTDDKNFIAKRKELYRYNLDCRKLAYKNSSLSIKRKIVYHYELVKYILWFRLKIIKCIIKGRNDL